MCDFCKTEYKGWKVKLKDKTISICANCLAYWGARLIGSTLDDKKYDFPNLVGTETCEITNSTDAIKITSDYDDNETYSLSPSVFTRFICHNLTKDEYHTLIRNGHKRTEFMIHDDFYSYDGHAYQPIK